VKQYFSSLVDAVESAVIHERLSTWHAQQPIPDNASSLEHVRPHILAIEHALRANNATRCRELCFLPLNRTYPFVEWLAAWGHYTTGIELLGRLAKAAPPLMRPEFLIACAALQRQLGVLDGAHDDLDEAIALLNSANLELEHSQLTLLAGALTNRGNVRWQTSRLNEAIEDYNRALTILDRLPLHNPNRDVQTACILMNRGIALRETGRFSEALIDCDRALQMYRDLVMGGMADLEPTLVSALINRGNVLANLRKPETALRDLDEAITVCNQLIEVGRQEIAPLIAHAQIMRVATLNDAGRAEEAIHQADKALGVLQRLIYEGRGDLESLLALGWLGRGVVRICFQQWSEALDDCNRAVEIYKRLIVRVHDIVDSKGSRHRRLLN
jgi:tetratricopeptide (TPR) repeat protein